MINNHPLISQLNKLKESSKEAVADAQYEGGDELKAYLHVERQVEKDLKEIIREASLSNKACLVLVCGNVGDGKSHLLSKICQDTNMADALKEFYIHNDATESFSPDQTCLETLSEILAPFSDDNISGCNDKWILAINLGTLSNFIEDQSVEFSKLKFFVEQNGIINPENFEIRDKYISDSNFQYVNFTNHHFYELTEDGAEPKLLETLLEKVITPIQENPIFFAYQQLVEEEWSLTCPVRINFETLFVEKNRQVIASLLVECILKDKLIISFRQILNFIHDMLVPYELSSLEFGKYKKVVLNVTSDLRLDYNLINYIFQRPQISKIFYSFHKLDPSIRRYESLDERAITLFTSTNPIDVFNNDFTDLSPSLTNNLGDQNGFKDILFKTYLRLRYFMNYKDIVYQDDYFKSFTKALFFSNTKDASGLKEINELVKNVALLWNGSTLEKNKIMFNSISKHSSYRLFRTIHFISILPRPSDKLQANVLHQFLTEVKIKFKKPTTHNSERDNVISIDVDYSLFLLLQKVKSGYRPNKLDRNSFINFVSLVDNLIYDNSENEELFIDEVNIGKHLDYTLKLDEYGDFKFSAL